MARGPTLTGVAVLAILIILAGFLAKAVRAHHGLAAAVHAPAHRGVTPGSPG